MNYEMEELVPLVAKLANKYTGMDSSSLSYEAAEQLMGAVLYCIDATEQSAGQEENKMVTTGYASAKEAYENGYRCVVEKVEKTLQEYHALLKVFQSYHNVYLNDTILKGMPKFFQWYDVRFHPQNTILTLDYPILRDIHEQKGINAIAEYIRCIRLEHVIKQLVVQYFEEDTALLDYLLLCSGDIAVRLQNAAEHDSVAAIFPSSAQSV